jgi:hypothetical protein
MRTAVIALALVAALAGTEAFAQGRGGAGRGGGAPVSGRAAALEDLTGYWVSVVTEHWHLRMLVPAKGDFAMLPLNAEARKVATEFDAAKEAAADQCKAYGAPAIMRVPGRIYVHWVDDNTLQLDTDSGSQTRLFRFGGAGGAQAAPAAATATAGTASAWQGTSVATWEGRGRGRGAPAPGSGGQLKVVTTGLRAGYLRRNGVPYSEKATLEEYFDAFTEPNGDQWLLVTSVINDPQYLTGPYVTTNHFKKLPDRSGWDPTPCRVDQAR